MSTSGSEGAGDAAELLRRLRERLVRRGGAEWIVGAVVDGAAVVLYRLDGRNEGLVEGARLDLADLGREVLGRPARDVDEVLVEALLQIVEPHPLGVTLDVRWADGLTPHPGHVRWHGSAVRTAERRG